MELDKHAKAILISYYKAHALWKSLSPGPEKVEAKRLRGQLHSKVISVIKLMAAAPTNPAN